MRSSSSICRTARERSLGLSLPTAARRAGSLSDGIDGALFSSLKLSRARSRSVTPNAVTARSSCASTPTRANNPRSGSLAGSGGMGGVRNLEAAHSSSHYVSSAAGCRLPQLCTAGPVELVFLRWTLSRMGSCAWLQHHPRAEPSPNHRGGVSISPSLGRPG